MVCAVAPPDGDTDALSAKLRAETPPVIARISDGRVLLDPRTVDAREDRQVESALAQVLGLAIPVESSDSDEGPGGESGASSAGGDGAGR